MALADDDSGTAGLAQLPRFLLQHTYTMSALGHGLLVCLVRLGGCKFSSIDSPIAYHRTLSAAGYTGRRPG